MTDRYYVEWESTVDDRYESDMLHRTDKVVRESGVSLYDRYGGSGGRWADNGYAVDARKIEPVLDLAQKVADAARYKVRVIIREDGAKWAAYPLDAKASGSTAAYRDLTVLQPTPIPS